MIDTGVDKTTQATSTRRHYEGLSKNWPSLSTWSIYGILYSRKPPL